MPEPTFSSKLKNSLKSADAAFRQDYADALKELEALTAADIKAITPVPTAQAEYDKLIAVVREATRRNLAQAELRQQIMELGSVAMSIAQNVAGLAKLAAL